MFLGAAGVSGEEKENGRNVEKKRDVREKRGIKSKNVEKDREKRAKTIDKRLWRVVY